MIEPKRLLFVVFLFGFITSSVLGQETSNANVSGQIADYLTGEPLPFSLAIIYEAEARDSAKKEGVWFKGIDADEQGRFQLKSIPVGEYFLEISYVGYQTKRTKNFSIESTDQQLDLKEIRLDLATNMLDGVEVVEEKSMFNVAIDRKVYNVEKDILAETGTATEI